MENPTNLVEIQNLNKHYPIHGGVFFRQIATVYAVNDVSFSIKKGETLGIVGESGCGKSTLGKTLLNLYSPTSGQVKFEGKNVFQMKKQELRHLRRDMQIILQDPYESLNSRHSVGQILEEPFIIHNIGDKEFRTKEVKSLLARVGLPESALHRYPHEFSGGQRQRIGIARAIALKPKLVVCDEPVSALDVSVQSQVLNLLVDLQKDLGLTYVFIAHDLSVVKHISDRIVVMYLGNVVELTDAQRIYEHPAHPYTQALISAIPVPDPEARANKQVLTGDVPNPRNPPTGCAFHTRCPYAKEKGRMERCKTEKPKLVNLSQIGKPTDKTNEKNLEHLVACHFANEIQKR